MHECYSCESVHVCFIVENFSTIHISLEKLLTFSISFTRFSFSSGLCGLSKIKKKLKDLRNEFNFFLLIDVSKQKLTGNLFINETLKKNKI